ncbi:glycine zipper domain-containing protein [Rhodopirellula sp. JC639]|uniref:glycine zipper domain-containing protein n=1 Tax=Stieleria mannarensis TaxID=2755585 RepID=UPI001602E871|nr:glycine zipper domain-containing protein [Rhodopirellula sp. JC639]
MTAIRPFGLFVSLVLVAICTPGETRAQVNQQRGATFGGLAGAIAGGLIGDHNDEAGAGAAIGGVVGAVAGGILGNAADKEAAMEQQRAAYYQSQRQQYAAQQQAVAQQSAVTLQDVISMSRNGLSDQVILNQVRQRGYLGKLAVGDIIALHQQGVSENVITALQSAGPPQASAPVATATPAPTIVEQRIYRPAPIIIEKHTLPYYPPPHYRHGRRPMFHYYHH